MNRIIVETSGVLAAPISNVATTLFVDQAFIDYVSSAVDFGAGDYFYLTLQEDFTREEIKVTNVGINYLVVVRGQGGTAGQAFSVLATYNSAINKASVLDIAAGSVPVGDTDVVMAGIGTAVESPPGTWTLDIPDVDIVGFGSVEVAKVGGQWQISLTDIALYDTDTDELSEGGTSTTLVASGIVSVVQSPPGTWTVGVPAPNFTGVGVTIAGAWPNLTFTVSGGGGGTVTSVTAGTGLTGTGSPTVNPTLAITNTLGAPFASTDIDFNQRGQATRVDATFNPVSVIAATAPIQVARAGHTVTVSAVHAAEGTVGVTAFADSGSPLDPADATTAVTPKLLATVLADISGTEIVNTQSYSGEADAAYTNTVATGAVALVLAAGQKALVLVDLVVRDDAAATVAQNIGMAIFSGAGAARIQSSLLISQNHQTMMFVITGAFNDTLVLKTTALPGTTVVKSYSINAIVFP